MRQYVASVLAALATLLRDWTGDTEYEHYVRACAQRDEPPLDRGRYFARRLEERYRGPGRCC
jgi:uncharacterized short protein YbdD (DUF466 family)